jgi:hypothetical protein
MPPVAGRHRRVLRAGAASMPGRGVETPRAPGRGVSCMHTGWLARPPPRGALLSARGVEAGEREAGEAPSTVRGTFHSERLVRHQEVHLQPGGATTFWAREAASTASGVGSRGSGDIPSCMHYGTERGEATVAGCAAWDLALLAGGRGRARLEGAVRCDAGSESAHGGARGRAGYRRLERLSFSPSCVGGVR